MAIWNFLPSPLRVWKYSVSQDLEDLRAALTQERRPVVAHFRSPAPKAAGGSTTHADRGRPPETTDVTHDAVVEFAASGTICRPTSDETLLEIATNAGIELAYSCTMGGCGACRIKLLRGTLSYEDEDVICITEEEKSAGYGLACVGRPRGRVVVNA